MTLSREDERRLLEGRLLWYRAGCELLDTSNNFIRNLAEFKPESSSWHFTRTAKIRTSATLAVAAELDWPRVRLRPWVEVSNGPPTVRDPITHDGEPVWDSRGEIITHGTKARPGYLMDRFYQGVFTVGKPDQRGGLKDPLYSLTCWDLLEPLNWAVGRTISIEAGELILPKVASIISPDLLQNVQRLRDTDANGIADGWQFVSVGSPTSLSSSVITDGGRTFQRFAATTSGTQRRYFTPTEQAYVVDGGHTYRVRVFSKGTRVGSSAHRFVLVWLTGSDVEVSTSEYPLPVASQWDQINVTVVPPAGAAKVRVRIDLSSSDGDSAATTIDVWQPSVIDVANDQIIVMDPVAAERTANISLSWPKTDGKLGIDIANALLQMAGCRPLYMDPIGALRMERFADPAAVGPRWHFIVDLAKQHTTIDEDRSISQAFDEVPNCWLLVQNTQGGAVPVPGAGLMEVKNFDDGPTSIAQRGVERWATRNIDAADQLAFEATALDSIVEDRSQQRVITLSSSKLPMLWDEQVVLFSDERLQGSSSVARPIRGLTTDITFNFGLAHSQYTISEVSDLATVRLQPAVITGGTVLYRDGYELHVFADDDTLTVLEGGYIDVAAITQGGQGGPVLAGAATFQGAGGGSAGEYGVLYRLAVDIGTIPLTIGHITGSVDPSETHGADGGSLTFGTYLTLLGGVGGGGRGQPGSSGPNGAGGGGPSGVGGTGTSGAHGGTGAAHGGNEAGGGGAGAGGGGAAGSGSDAVIKDPPEATTTWGGPGGPGLPSWVDGTIFGRGGGGGSSALGGEGGGDGGSASNGHPGAEPGDGGGGAGTQTGVSRIGGEGGPGRIWVRTARSS